MVVSIVDEALSLCVCLSNKMWSSKNKQKFEKIQNLNNNEVRSLLAYLETANSLLVSNFSRLHRVHDNEHT